MTTNNNTHAAASPEPETVHSLHNTAMAAVDAKDFYRALEYETRALLRAYTLQVSTTTRYVLAKSVAALARDIVRTESDDTSTASPEPGAVDVRRVESILRAFADAYTHGASRAAAYNVAIEALGEVYAAPRATEAEPGAMEALHAAASDLRFVASGGQCNPETLRAHADALLAIAATPRADATACSHAWYTLTGVPTCCKKCGTFGEPLRLADATVSGVTEDASNAALHEAVMDAVTILYGVHGNADVYRANDILRMALVAYADAKVSYDAAKRAKRLA